MSIEDTIRALADHEDEATRAATAAAIERVLDALDHPNVPREHALRSHLRASLVALRDNP